MKLRHEDELYTTEDLLDILHLLRNPETGCPWDKVQTHQSIRMNFLEETCEALEAIDLEDSELLCEELGDVLMQVAFHSVLEEEQGRFSYAQVADGVCRKLIFRHPHIFAPQGQNCGQSHPDPDHQEDEWNKLKGQEKGRVSLADELDSVPATLPALLRAAKIQKRAERFGIGRCTAAQAAQTMQACAQALAETAAAGQDTASALGALLFATVQVGRLTDANAELALIRAAQNFAEQAKNTEELM